MSQNIAIEAWKARGRELNALYDALVAVVEEPAVGFDPVADLKALGAQRDRLRAENERLVLALSYLKRDVEDFGSPRRHQHALAKAERVLDSCGEVNEGEAGA